MKKWLFPINKNIRRLLTVIAAVLCLGVGTAGGKLFLDFTSRNAACKSCHLASGVQPLFNAALEEHKDVGKPSEQACASCHPDKRVWHYLHRETENLLSFYNDFTVDPNPYGVQEESETSFDARCLTCHKGTLNVDSAPPERLTSKLAEIGVRPAHEIHHRFTQIQPQDSVRYEELKAIKNPTEKEKQEFDLLSRIVTSSCDECHRYTKTDKQGNPSIDRTVNYAAREPLGCTACHIDIHSDTHPDPKAELTFPSRYVCRRCHNGRYHARMVIFAADCDEKPSAQNIETCKKCHPNIGLTLEKELWTTR
jgi:nitrate/TMAO reductase-like tetraheme cytochrome c subunit